MGQKFFRIQTSKPQTLNILPGYGQAQGLDTAHEYRLQKRPAAGQEHRTKVRNVGELMMNG